MAGGGEFSVPRCKVKVNWWYCFPKWIEVTAFAALMDNAIRHRDFVENYHKFTAVTITVASGLKFIYLH